MNLAFERFGSGDPFIILHGLFGSGDNWRSMCLALAKDFEVIAPDLRNHGNSPHQYGMSYAEMATDIVEFMDKLRIASAHILGHSMGGKTAMEFALRSAHRVRSLISVDIGPQRYPPRHLDILRALGELDLGAATTRQELEVSLENTIADLATRRFLLKNVARDAKGSFFWKMGLAEIRAAYPEICAGVAGHAPCSRPALFIKGETSDYLEESDLPAIRELFPSAELVVISGAGHWVQVDSPDALLGQLKHFLQRQDARKNL